MEKMKLRNLILVFQLNMKKKDEIKLAAYLLVVIEWNRYSTAHQIGNFAGVRSANEITELVLFN